MLRKAGSPRKARRARLNPLVLLLDAALTGELEVVQQAVKEVSAAEREVGAAGAAQMPGAGLRLSSPPVHSDERSEPAQRGGHHCPAQCHLRRQLLHRGLPHHHGCQCQLPRQPRLVSPDPRGGLGPPWADAQPLMHPSPQPPTPTSRTPLHCAASCNDTVICMALVQHGAAIFATTLSDGATAFEKCDPYREGYADCATYLAGARQGCWRGQGYWRLGTWPVRRSGEGRYYPLLGRRRCGGCTNHLAGLRRRRRRRDGLPAGVGDCALLREKGTWRLCYVSWTPLGRRVAVKIGLFTFRIFKGEELNVSTLPSTWHRALGKWALPLVGEALPHPWQVSRLQRLERGL